MLFESDSCNSSTCSVEPSQHTPSIQGSSGRRQRYASNHLCWRDFLVNQMGRELVQVSWRLPPLKHPGMELFQPFWWQHPNLVSTKRTFLSCRVADQGQAIVSSSWCSFLWKASGFFLFYLLANDLNPAVKMQFILMMLKLCVSVNYSLCLKNLFSVCCFKVSWGSSWNSSYGDSFLLFCIKRSQREDMRLVFS